MSSGVNRKEWTAVRFPKGLLGEIEKFLKTKDAERRGFTSVSGYLASVVRKDLGLD